MNHTYTQTYKIRPQKEDCLIRMLGRADCPPTPALEAYLDKTYDALLPAFLSVCLPEGGFSIVDRADASAPALAGLFPSAAQTALVLYTLGDGIDALIEDALQKGEYLNSLLLNAMADSALLALDEALCQTIEAYLRDKGLAATNRFIPFADEASVSDKGLSPQLQAAIVSNVPLQSNISITAGSMFSPLKTCSFAFGVLTANATAHCGHPALAPAPTLARQNCTNCPQSGCPIRRPVTPSDTASGSDDITILARTDTGQTVTFTLLPGQTLWDALQSSGLPLPPGDCGGRGSCGKCRVRVEKGNLPSSPQDAALLSATELAEGWRLACTARPQANLSIFLSPEREIETLTEYRQAAFPTGMDCRNEPATPQPLRNPAAPLGVAVDIGTTTIALELWNLPEGKPLGAVSITNSQRGRFGADIMSRLADAAGQADALRRCLVNDILSALQKLCHNEDVLPRRITRVTLAGHCTMLHLLLGLSTDGLGQYPFRPAKTDFGTDLPFETVFESRYLNAVVGVVPCASAFIGGDVIAGAVFTRLTAPGKTSLLVDLGTNGEMLLFAGGKAGGKLIGTSVAAGPAFEGGNIRQGVGGVPGAIDRVSYHNGQFAVHTISGVTPPVGLCGSGLLDAVGVLVQNGLVDETGLIRNKNWQVSGVPICGSVQLTQKDIRELQYAKAAVRTGIEILLAQAGLTPEALDTLYLAGGFGQALQVESATAIGLLPPLSNERIISVGNASLGGAAALLLSQDWETARQIAAGTSEIHLAALDEFQDAFLRQMYF